MGDTNEDVDERPKWKVPSERSGGRMRHDGGETLPKDYRDPTIPTHRPGTSVSVSHAHGTLANEDFGRLTLSESGYEGALGAEDEGDDCIKAVSPDVIKKGPAGTLSFFSDPGPFAELFNHSLYGVVIVQTWTYYWHDRRRDSMIMKGFIAFLLAMATVHTALCVYMLYWYLIQNFADVNNLDINMSAMESQISINSFIAFLIQLFYARRLYLMSNSVIFPVIIVGLAVLVLILALISTVREHVLKRFSRYRPLTWSISIGLGGCSLVDILVASLMCWCLYHKRTGFARTDSILMNLMIYSICTGLLTSILATTALFIFIGSPTTITAQAFYGPLGTCYLNSLLALLNNRDLIREGFTNSGSNRTRHRSKPGPTGISVTVRQTAAMDFAGRRHTSDTEPCVSESKRLEGTPTTFPAHEEPSESNV
ncbi:hypothetical protein BJV74DRAFT_990423 [Russula compacta]|nr:hypothetical protein BJV74DRAFT_990423 [Russula compacta]